MDFALSPETPIEWDILDKEIEILNRKEIKIEDVIQFYENLIFNKSRKAIFRVFSEKFESEAKNLDYE